MLSDRNWRPQTEISATHTNCKVRKRSAVLTVCPVTAAPSQDFFSLDHNSSPTLFDPPALNTVRGVGMRTGAAALAICDAFPHGILHTAGHDYIEIVSPFDVIPSGSPSKFDQQCPALPYANAPG
jgi:hypothetical protein